MWRVATRTATIRVKHRPRPLGVVAPLARSRLWLCRGRARGAVAPELRAGLIHRPTRA